jgi:uncharacterized membrane protein
VLFLLSVKGFFNVLFDYVDDGIEIIVFVRSVAQDFAALRAAVADFMVVAAHLGPNRFKRPTASVGAVAGVYIDMLAPKALRAMVGVAIAFDLGPAVFAGEILYCSLEFG